MRSFLWYYLIPSAIFSLFASIMIYVTYLAYSRTPGSTGQDMAEIQITRYQAIYSNDSSLTQVNPL